MRLPLTIEIHRSRRLIAALLLAHLIAAAGLWPVDFPLWVKVAVWCALTASVALTIGRRYPEQLTLHADGRLGLIAGDGSVIEYRVDSATTVFPWLILLLLDSPCGRVALTLPGDALGDEGHRQLRMWLKWKASDGSA